MAPSQRRAALQRFGLTIGLSTAIFVVLFAALAPASLLASLQVRVAIGLVGGGVLIGSLLLGLPKKKRARVTAPRTTAGLAR